MTTSTGRRLLREETLHFLKNFKLPEYQLENDGNGGYNLSFERTRATSMMWEIPALKIINSLYLYHYAKKANVTPSEWNGVMTRMFARLYENIDTIK